MDDRFQFWKNPASWPDDAYGFVFLARAIQRIGKATFAGEWTDTEPFTAPPIETLQSMIERGVPALAALEAYRKELSALIASNDPSKLLWKVETYRVRPSLQPLRTARDATRSGPRSSVPSDDGFRTRQVLSDEAVKYGEGLIPEENRKRNEAKERWARVLGLVKDALRDGKLGYVTLPTHGGAFSASQPKEWWNVPGIENRITMCRMNPAAPYGFGFAGNGYEYIFVGEADLERLLPQPPKPKNSDEVKALEDRAIEIYKQIKARDGYITSDIFKDVCRKERPKISTTISGRIYKKMHNNA
ncbi:hypothetical protein [Agrobacterium leguminum]|uniref:hypothetical protein n=1 Tax=Agrobacterium leguminum TaxID=2792015 RepID=UPI003CE49FEC